MKKIDNKKKMTIILIIGIIILLIFSFVLFYNTTKKTEDIQVNIPSTVEPSNTGNIPIEQNKNLPKIDSLPEGLSTENIVWKNTEATVPEDYNSINIRGVIKKENGKYTFLGWELEGNQNLELYVGENVQLKVEKGENRTLIVHDITLATDLKNNTAKPVTPDNFLAEIEKLRKEDKYYQYISSTQQTNNQNGTTTTIPSTTTGVITTPSTTTGSNTQTSSNTNTSGNPTNNGGYSTNTPSTNNTGTNTQTNTNTDTNQVKTLVLEGELTTDNRLLTWTLITTEDLNKYKGKWISVEGVTTSEEYTLKVNKITVKNATTTTDNLSKSGIITKTGDKYFLDNTYLIVDSSINMIQYVGKEVAIEYQKTADVNGKETVKVSNVFNVIKIEGILTGGGEFKGDHAHYKVGQYDLHSTKDLTTYLNKSVSMEVAVQQHGQVLGQYKVTYISILAN